METMRDWFGLKNGHTDFFVNNETDRRVLFARSDLDVELKSRLDRCFRTSYPPKLVLYGNWGAGKTHTMRHIEYELERNSEYKAMTFFAELPDVSKKTTFQVAHAAFMDCISQDNVRKWFSLFHARKAAETEELVRKFTQSGDIAKAFMSLLLPGDGARIAWDWLRGVDLKASEARTIGLPQSLEQSTQLVAVLRMIGLIVKEIEDRVLILFLDEAEKLKDVTDGIPHWTASLRHLADVQNRQVGFIIAASFRDLDDGPDALIEQNVRSRIGEKNYLQLPDFQADEAEVFCKNLLGDWIDPQKRDQILEKFSSEAGNEKVNPALFPFTEQGFDKFVTEYCLREGSTNPRGIQQEMDTVFNRAMDDKRHLLSRDYLDSATL
jgi:Cdc6-like AAA superfamily ATPase